MEKTVKNIAVLATPLGLMAMGASFEWKKAFAMVKPALACSALKLVALPPYFCLQLSAWAFGMRRWWLFW